MVDHLLVSFKGTGTFAQNGARRQRTCACSLRFVMEVKSDLVCSGSWLSTPDFCPKLWQIDCIYDEILGCSGHLQFMAQKKLDIA